MSSMDQALAREPDHAPAAPAFKPDRLYHATFLVLSSSVLVLSFFLSVRDRTQVIVPVLAAPLPELCLARRMSGLACPGCGLTRCFISLAHGDAEAAWSYNPAGILLFCLVALQLPYRTLQLWRIRRFQPEITLGIWPIVLFGAFAIAIFSQWLLRLVGFEF